MMTAMRTKPVLHPSLPTPLIDLGAHGLPVPRGNRILAKIEYDRSVHPTGSHYDRVFFPLIDMHEKEEVRTPSGNLLPRISPRSTVLVEVSTGNAGAAFAYAAAQKGYGSIVLVPHGLPPARLECMRRYARQVVEAPSADMAVVLELLRGILRLNQEDPPKRFVCLNHSFHALGTVMMSGMVYEALEQSPRTIDYYVATIGNGLTLCGPSRLFKIRNPDGRVLAWEPVASGLVYDRLARKFANSNTIKNYRDRFGLMPGTLGHAIYGAIRPGTPTPFVDRACRDGLIDEIHLVGDSSQQREYCQLTGKTEWPAGVLSWEPIRPLLAELPSLLAVIGSMPGRTSLAGLAVALHAAESVENKTFLVPFFDSIEKY